MWNFAFFLLSRILCDSKLFHFDFIHCWDYFRISLQRIMLKFGVILVIFVSKSIWIFICFKPNDKNFPFQILQTSGKPLAAPNDDLELFATEFIKFQSRETKLYDQILSSLSATKTKLDSPSVSSSVIVDIVRLIEMFQQFATFRHSIQTELMDLVNRVNHLSDSNEVSKLNEFNDITKRMSCLKGISSCMNLEVIAKRLSSPQVSCPCLNPLVERYENDGNLNFISVG